MLANIGWLFIILVVCPSSQAYSKRLTGDEFDVMGEAGEMVMGDLLPIDDEERLASSGYDEFDAEKESSAGTKNSNSAVDVDMPSNTIEPEGLQGGDDEDPLYSESEERDILAYYGMFLPSPDEDEEDDVYGYYGSSNEFNFTDEQRNILAEYGISSEPFDYDELEEEEYDLPVFTTTTTKKTTRKPTTTTTTTLPVTETSTTTTLPVTETSTTTTTTTLPVTETSTTTTLVATTTSPSTTTTTTTTPIITTTTILLTPTKLFPVKETTKNEVVTKVTENKPPVYSTQRTSSEELTKDSTTAMRNEVDNRLPSSANPTTDDISTTTTAQTTVIVPELMDVEDEEEENVVSTQSIIIPTEDEITMKTDKPTSSSPDKVDSESDEQQDKTTSASTTSFYMTDKEIYFDVFDGNGVPVIPDEEVETTFTEQHSSTVTTAREEEENDVNKHTNMPTEENNDVFVAETTPGTVTANKETHLPINTKPADKDELDVGTDKGSETKRVAAGGMSTPIMIAIIVAVVLFVIIIIIICAIGTQKRRRGKYHFKEGTPQNNKTDEEEPLDNGYEEKTNGTPTAIKYEAEV